MYAGKPLFPPVFFFQNQNVFQKSIPSLFTPCKTHYDAMKGYPASHFDHLLTTDANRTHSRRATQDTIPKDQTSSVNYATSALILP
jgi:hypothetical protein